MLLYGARCFVADVLSSYQPNETGYGFIAKINATTLGTEYGHVWLREVNRQ